MTYTPFQPGHPGYKKKGTKHKKTIEREKRRAIFDEEVSDLFLETIKKAKAEYLLDQFIGKAPDKIDLNVQGEINVNPAVKKLAEKLLNEQRNNG